MSAWNLAVPCIFGDTPGVPARPKPTPSPEGAAAQVRQEPTGGGLGRGLDLPRRGRHSATAGRPTIVPIRASGLVAREKRPVCGRSSVVERQLPKLYVVGSIPIARSRSHK